MPKRVRNRKFLLFLTVFLLISIPLTSLAVLNTRDTRKHAATVDYCYDFNGDGKVGVEDILRENKQYGQKLGMATYDPIYDLDGDNAVTVGDTLRVQNQYFRKCTSGVGGDSYLYSKYDTSSYSTAKNVGEISGSSSNQSTCTQPLVVTWAASCREALSIAWKPWLVKLQCSGCAEQDVLLDANFQPISAALTRIDGQPVSIQPNTTYHYTLCGGACGYTYGFSVEEGNITTSSTSIIRLPTKPYQITVIKSDHSAQYQFSSASSTYTATGLAAGASYLVTMCLPNCSSGQLVINNTTLYANSSGQLVISGQPWTAVLSCTGCSRTLNVAAATSQNSTTINNLDSDKDYTLVVCSVSCGSSNNIVYKSTNPYHTAICTKYNLQLNLSGTNSIARSASGIVNTTAYFTGLSPSTLYDLVVTPDNSAYGGARTTSGWQTDPCPVTSATGANELGLQSCNADQTVNVAFVWKPAQGAVDYRVEANVYSVWVRSPNTRIQPSGYVVETYTWNNIPSTTKFRIVTQAYMHQAISQEFSLTLRSCPPPPPPVDPKPAGCPIDTIYHATTYSGHENNAIDVSGPDGGTVKATMPGNLIRNGSDGSGYGNYAVVQSEGQYRTLYAHMRSTGLRAAGTSVIPGDKLGEQGSTGYTSPPGFSHVHYEVAIWQNGTWYYGNTNPYAAQFGCPLK